jgi:hypothetical protein
VAKRHKAIRERGNVPVHGERSAPTYYLPVPDADGFSPGLQRASRKDASSGIFYVRNTCNGRHAFNHFCRTRSLGVEPLAEAAFRVVGEGESLEELASSAFIIDSHNDYVVRMPNPIGSGQGEMMGRHRQARRESWEHRHVRKESAPSGDGDVVFIPLANVAEFLSLFKGWHVQPVPVDAADAQPDELAFTVPGGMFPALGRWLAS